jgi:hypothetical protein
MFSLIYLGPVANCNRMNDCGGRYSDTSFAGLKTSYDRHGTIPGVQALDRQKLHTAHRFAQLDSPHRG